MAELPVAQSAPKPVEAEAPQAAVVVTPVEGECLILATEGAVAKAHRFLAQEEDPEGKVLRVGVDSGGCSGFSYKVEVGVEKPGDHVQVYTDGLKIVCDPVGLTFIKGSVLDYIDGIGEANFKFSNPQASSTCGCGISFTPA